MPDAPAPSAGPRVATYRWQLTPDDGFAAAAAAVPTLAALGCSHLYLSPMFQATPGSMHGYDVVDPTRISDDLGGPDAFAGLVAACRGVGLRLLLDIVPNHLAAHDANPFWWDVLRLGPASRWAGAFDIDWNPPKRELADTVLLPVLGDHYGRELEAGRIRVERGDGPGHLLVVAYFERRLPLSPATTGAILDEVARLAADDVLGVAARVLARVERGATDLDARDADLLVAERTAAARLDDPALAALLDAHLAVLNGDADALDLVLEQQSYRLARWSVGDAELDYRRFFDVDGLVATRVEREDAFLLLSSLPIELIHRDPDVVDGLRVDHVDGLRDPATYLERLRAACGDDAWLVVEKILRVDEQLPDTWPIQGTTGYEVAELLSGWSTDPDGAEVLLAAWRERTGESRSFEEVALQARREVLANGLAADVSRVVNGLVRVCEGRRRHRDHSRHALHDAIVEIAVHAPGYRSYVRPDLAGQRVLGDDVDRRFVATAVDAARQSQPALDPELFDLVHDILVGDLAGPAEAEVALRFQQLTGPVAAKGEEDTALYRYLPLPHRCDVGGDPGHLHRPAAEWHAAAVTAQAAWPQRLTTLSTHDSKRSADARARLAALTTMADLTVTSFDTWWNAASHLRGSLDAGTGWLVFHTLVAGEPLPLDRAWPTIEKSVREAGVHTSWTAVDDRWEHGLRTLVEGALADQACTAVIGALVEAVGATGDALALAQLAVQLLGPGVPDVYQGGERWDRSGVDPDNRRRVDPAARSALVEQAATADAASAWSTDDLRASGLPRTVLLRGALALRRRKPATFGPGADGAYVPVTVGGPGRESVLAFSRGRDPDVVVVVRRPGDEAEVHLPSGVWIDVLTDAKHEGAIAVDDLLAAFPVAVLERA